MTASRTLDMTVGSPLRKILKFSIPIIFGTLFQQMYNMVDAVIVGKFLGVNQLAAVGSVGSLHFFILGFCIGVCSGMAIPIAQRFGAKDEGNLRKYVANAIWVAAVVAVVFTAVTLALSEKILMWMRIPAAIFEDTCSYFFTLMAGIPATILYNLSANTLRSLGDSRHPLVYLIISSVCNVVLDLAFIIVFGMGTAGAALATVLSQLLSGVLCLRYSKKHLPILHISREERKLSMEHIKTLCGIGLPMGLQFSITAIGSLMLSRAVNGLGETAVASMTAGGKITQLFQSGLDSMGTAVATYAGQNTGAGKPERVRQGCRVITWVLMGYCVVAYLVLFFFGRSIALLFVDAGETAVLDNVQLFLRMNSAFLPFLVFVDVDRNAIQGMGYSRVALIAGLLEMVARSLVAKLLVPLFGFSGACVAHGTAWVLADCFLIPCFLVTVRKVTAAMCTEKV